MSGEYDLLRAFLSDRVIAFHPRLAVLFGGVNEALFFQQLAYWSERAADPEWVYKTQRELQEETTLTRTQQENARKRLRALGVIEEERRGLPARLYYRVVWARLFTLLDQSAGNLQTRSRATGATERGKPAAMTAANPPPLTEMTPKSTKEKTKRMPEDLERIDEWIARAKRAGF